ncbi:glycerophosphodiester phosphodiesterase family protein [Corynebacterium aquatimens]|uniref:Glycerophosphoryl diester phosphodiesterase n=1 Tax=Corynebacterium aquatimens TaxID=1190508 RepID=A0A931GXY6_9CORY|nr:glycerophosphodiester phosphodiesterase family protein [Corynebacterium aquatimens]MBG6122819.1 glycerophosphoryl diester phosphodiesterase [Corynebacterium aquatimens]WJY66846.1 putative glycerophosphoryl diester phosphodiesterase 1 [Corynebacterium aquatimens]
MTASVVTPAPPTTVEAGPHIIAHRGASGLYPESTPRAFQEALKLPIHGIECDVRLTRDGKLVVHHDNTVNRCSNGRGRVAKMDFSDMRELNYGTAEDPQRVLLLDELLDILDDHPGKHIYIETKHPTRYGPEVDEQTVRTLWHRGMLEDPRVHLISFSHRAMRYFADAVPDLETYYLFRLREKKWNKNNCMLSRPYGVGPGITHLKARRELLHFKGLKTYTWTVNNPADMRWCRDNRVDAFATDQPQLALEVLYPEALAASTGGYAGLHG